MSKGTCSDDAISWHPAPILNIWHSLDFGAKGAGKEVQVHAASRYVDLGFGTNNGGASSQGKEGMIFVLMIVAIPFRGQTR
jgi:hypothetical protein